MYAKYNNNNNVSLHVGESGRSVFTIPLYNLSVFHKNFLRGLEIPNYYNASSTFTISSKSHSHDCTVLNFRDCCRKKYNCCSSKCLTFAKLSTEEKWKK